MVSKRKTKKLQTNKRKIYCSKRKSAITRKKNKKSRTIRKKKSSLKRRYRLMNEDVMKKILSNLSIEELLRLERISQQFKYCVNEVLKRQKGLKYWENQLSHYVFPKRTFDNRWKCKQCFRYSKSQLKSK